MPHDKARSGKGISTHFKRESKFMVWFLIGVPLIGVLVAGLLLPFVWNWSSK